jgi:hypothetical protein
LGIANQKKGEVHESVAACHRVRTTLQVGNGRGPFRRIVVGSKRPWALRRVGLGFHRRHAIICLVVAASNRRPLRGGSLLCLVPHSCDRDSRNRRGIHSCYSRRAGCPYGLLVAPTIYDVSLRDLVVITERDQSVAQRGMPRQDTFWHFRYVSGETQSLNLPDLFAANREQIASYLVEHGKKMQVTQ